MDKKTKSFYLKFFRLVAIWLVLPFVITIVGITLAVQALKYQETVYVFGSSIDGIGDYFIGSRLAIVIFIIFFWKDIVRFYGKWKGLNLRQIHAMKKLHWLVALSLFVIEIMAYVPAIIELGR